MDRYSLVVDHLKSNQYTWLITGVAGFIGSNLLEKLLKLNQKVVGIDNFATGYRENIDQALADSENSSADELFTFIEGDIRDIGICRKAMKSIDFVLHHAALGSVPRSIEDAIATNEVNIDGFLNILVSARDENVKSFVYAASSSTYGDHPGLPKVEDRIGNPLSPYAVTKLVDELYADVFHRVYGMKSVGLRYFNVFGKRQDPGGAYAAVIPRWITAMVKGEAVYINGDGDTSRDFCYIENAIQINLLAATKDISVFDEPVDADVDGDEGRGAEVFNVAVGDRTSLKELQRIIEEELVSIIELPAVNVIFQDFRPGDVRHSQADISKAKNALGYHPSHSIREGLHEVIPWYVRHLA